MIADMPLFAEAIFPGVILRPAGCPDQFHVGSQYFASGLGKAQSQARFVQNPASVDLH
jgi:hypothetical protein